MSGSRKRKADEIETTHGALVVAVAQKEATKRAKPDSDNVDWWNPMDALDMKTLMAWGGNPAVDKIVKMADRFGKENALGLCRDIQAFYDYELRPYAPGLDRSWSLESIHRWMAQRSAKVDPANTTPSITPDVKSDGPKLPPRQPIAMALRTETTDEWDREMDDEQQSHASCLWCRARPPRGDCPTYMVEFGKIVQRAAEGIVYTFCDVSDHRCMVEHAEHYFPSAKSDAA